MIYSQNKLLLLLLFIITSLHSIGQTVSSKDKKALKEAERYLKIEEYHFVEDEMLVATKTSQNNALMWYYLGIATFHSPTKNKVDALPYFQKANILQPDMRQIDYWLGRTYHLVMEFDSAIVKFEKAKAILQSETEETLKEKKKLAGYTVFTEEELDRYIDQCKRGPAFFAKADNKLMLNLSLANTYLPDLAPIITVDGSRLYFTSHRQDISSHHELDPHDQLPYQDVFYMDRREDGFWHSPKEFSEINTDEHDAAIALSSDGNQLFMYRSYGKSTNNPGNIYEVNYRDGKWSEPTSVSAPINSTAHETHMSMSADGKAIIFVSDREDPEAQGGKDLYIIRKLPNGEWAEAQNLGGVINSDLDEESPYIHPNGKTLYFSSQGHHSIGGFDVFKIDIDLMTGELGTLEQLNYPVNSPSDDIFYVMSADGEESYFSSVREEGMGGFDIYCVKNNEANIQKVVFFKFAATTEDEKNAAINLKLINIKTQEIERELDFININTPVEFMHRCYGNYGVILTADNYLLKSERIDFSKYNSGTVNYTKTYTLQPFAENRSEELNNIYFKENELDMAASAIELKLLKEFIEKHPDQSIEVVGHSNYNDDKSDLVLEFESKTRSMESLEGMHTVGYTDDALVDQNIGYGTRFPLYLADDEESWKNERMEYIIRPKGYQKTLSRAANCQHYDADLSYNELLVEESNDDVIDINKDLLNHLLAELRNCAVLELVITADESKKGLADINAIIDYMVDHGVEREQLSSKFVKGAKTGVNLRYIENTGGSEDGYVNYDPEHDHEEIHQEIVGENTSNEDLEFEKRVEDMTIQFPFDSKEFSTTHHKILSEIKEYLTKNPKKSLKITGHTDSSGPAVYNTYLGMERAKSVGFFFKDIENPNRIIVDSKGEDEPLVSNATKEGRRQNRRIHFKFAYVGNSK
ncbi:PD40 domain-containing protein [Flammeovirga yaeyamensis]|uniref:PD40 domain-containing protein n=1 Tax=Flammeovirga yaeyamensis TaxID=367791 RepID=A0AAX1N5N3_9BACT|nr:OmpA family protein [Flammeovirga yaeyamensis]MBB3701226.1 outer membrane protein OmpA-like peptidoglycan-associated protein/tetratricopeptide (TPR) repeat protein [Flammeovirga yaeyamensis]NMF38448.1 OmpA family protein [Flammeovirga yaeyamensis]QWG01691.1 PD40 domain-containing protein [Flammeovirga yaeyamensis]